MILISPAEPRSFKSLGVVSSHPEMVGADFFWVAKKETWGVQRKELKDFIASVNDGRLAKEIAQSKLLDHFVVIVEGQPIWTDGGELAGRGYGGRWTRAQHDGVIWSLQQEGIWYRESRNTDDTGKLIEGLCRWSEKAEHRGVRNRPAAPGGIWGTVENEDYLRHLVMGLPFVGSELAERIVEKFGCPFEWRVSVEELEGIVGIGKVKARKIYNALVSDYKEIDNGPKQQVRSAMS